MEIKNRRYLFELLKFHPVEYLQELQKGRIYCRSIRDFIELDSSDGRGDDTETLTSIRIDKAMTMDLRYTSDTHYTFQKLPDGNVKITSYNDDLYANLFCLSALYSDEDLSEYTFDISEGMKAMGSHVLVIKEPNKFLNLLANKLKELEIPAYGQFVEYLEINGRKTYFQKPIKYSYQKEFRVLIKNLNQDTLIIDIGNISDISEIMAVKDYPSKRKIVPQPPTYTIFRVKDSDFK